MILLKIAIAILTVTAFFAVAEKVSPQAAGILSGYALGSATSLFLIGLEQEPDFVTASAPSKAAGVISAFLAVLFPRLFIIHSTYSVHPAHTIIKNMPTGLWSLVLYASPISVVYPKAGIYWGTIIGFAAASLYRAALALWNEHPVSSKLRSVLFNQENALWAWPLFPAKTEFSYPGPQSSQKGF